MMRSCGEKLTPIHQAGGAGGVRPAETRGIEARLADLLIAAADEGGFTFEQLANGELSAADIAELVRVRKRDLRVTEVAGGGGNRR
jgi:hypothetical protein